MDLDRAGIGKAADAAKRPEMMVERAVLLHQNHDVLNVANRSGAVVCLDGRGLGNVRFERTRGDGGHTRQLQEFAAVHLAHEVPFSSIARFGKSQLHLNPAPGTANGMRPENRGSTLPADDATMT